MRTAAPGWLAEASPDVLFREARRRQRRRWLAVGAAVAVVLGGVAGVAASVAGHPRSPVAAQASAAIPAAANGCIGQPPVSPLPAWARSGFSPADLAMPHVMGAAGNIVAILWAPRDALHAPPRQDRTNKILWVPRIPPSAPNLVIQATLAGSARTATVSVPGGPGPSIIDLPASGCWTLHLRWSGHTDELKLRYVA
ncbi:MAG TPA: hypothetical protein VMG38_23765 [Trebonia sp.]|nr:hypothetical protein [Trebonia sp.]